ncbi:Degradation in endoplasmic reticulum protein 3 [Intoshia linei]|uniref:Derlin n=1 Tax=Intoshia linei TaxID=1819745 RepID=A0A177B976_9BILA|nr:Degradation in endoplasmic reticulum protein 3 [Intoshia linei]
MAMQELYEDYRNIPPFTRYYTSSCFIMTLLTHFELVTPYQIYLNFPLIIKNFQIWRLFTNIFYFGPFGINFIFNIIFVYRHSRMLEEETFMNETPNFLLFIVTTFIIITILGVLSNLIFLSHSLMMVFVYLWSRRKPNVLINMMGLFTFRAPYLPWVLVSISFLLMGESLWTDLIGIFAGHVYFYFKDVFPTQSGIDIFVMPKFIEKYFKNDSIPTTPEADGAENIVWQQTEVAEAENEHKTENQEKNIDEYSSPEKDDNLRLRQSDTK